jgi:hypothetical protein
LHGQSLDKVSSQLHFFWPVLNSDWLENGGKKWSNDDIPEGEEIDGACYHAAQQDHSKGQSGHGA